MWNPQNQVFQNWIFPVDGHDELLQFRDRQIKADAADTPILLLKCKDYCLFVLCSDVCPLVIDDEWEGW
jgi:hypothetical protein